MRTRLLGLLCLVTFCLGGWRAPAAHVVFHFEDGSGVPQAGRPHYLFPIGAPVTNGNGGTVTRDRIYRTTDLSGNLTISNIFGWAYRGELQGTYGVSTNYYNFPVTGGLIYASDYTTVATNGPAGILAYSQGQADGRFFLKASGVGTNGTFVSESNSDTNVFHAFGSLYPQANVNWFYSSAYLSARIFTNAVNSYKFAYDPTENLVNEWEIGVGGGTPNTWTEVLYSPSFDLGTWFDSNGSPQSGMMGGFGLFYPAIVGDLYSGTNINGANIVAGSVPASALETTNFSPVVGDFRATGDGSFSNLWAYASGVRGLPPAGAVWKNSSLPLIIATTYSVDNVNVGGPREQDVTNIIAYWKRNGALAAVTAHGFRPLIHKDVGWASASRDSNGQIQYDATKFPHGGPWMSNYEQTNGFGGSCSLYFSGHDIATGGGIFEPVMTMNTIFKDIHQIRNGLYFAGLRASDGNGNNLASYQLEYARALAYAVLYPDNLPAAQTNRTGLIIDMLTHDRLVEGLGQFINGRASDQGIGSGSPAARAMYRLRVGFSGDGTTNGATAISQQSGKGHNIGYLQSGDYVDPNAVTVDDYRTWFGALSIAPEEFVCAQTNWSATFLLHFTNNTFLSILGDPLCLPGGIIYDNGASSTAEFARPLTNGNINVLLRNDGGTSSNMVVTFSQVHNPPEWAPLGSPVAQWGIPANTLVKVDHVFGNGGVSTNIGTFTGSVTQAVAAGASELLLLTPQYDNRFVLKSGDTVTGPLVVQADFVANTVASTSGYQGDASSLSNYNGAKLTGGTVTNRSSGAVSGDISAATGLTSNQVPNLDASKIVTGVLSSNQVPGLNASNLVAGTIASARLSLTSNDVPNLDASKLVTGLIAKGQAGSVTNHSDVKITGQAPTAGQILQFDGVNWTNAPAPSTASGLGYTIMLLGSGNNNPVANTTYYFGEFTSRLLNTSYSLAQIDVPKAGSIKRVQYKWDISGTLGSTEVVNYFIEITNATDVLNFASPMNTAITNSVQTGSAGVSAGDTIVLKIVTPSSWGTPATTVRWCAQVYIE